MAKTVHIDKYDPGYSWMREKKKGEPVQAPSVLSDDITCHSKLVWKIFHQYGRNKEQSAVKAFRYYIVSKHHFGHKGYFEIEQLADVLQKVYGYNYQNRGAKHRLAEELRGFKTLFKETCPGTFTFTSWRKLVGRQRFDKDTFTFNKSLLHKESKTSLIDVLINVQARGQIIPTQNLCNQTGYCRARVFKALSQGAEHGFNKHAVRAPINKQVYKTHRAALNARKSYYQEGILTDVIEVENQYYLMAKVGNCFNSFTDAGAEGIEDLKPLHKTRAAASECMRATSTFKAMKMIHGVIRNSISEKMGELEFFILAEFVHAPVRFIDRHRIEQEQV